MLDALRRHSRSFLTWLVFGFLIAVFIIGFGTPASNKLSCGEDVSVGRVGDRKISREELMYAFRLMLREDMPPTARAYVMDLLLRREILAMEAKRLGFQTAKPPEDASEDPDVVDLITHRKVLILGFERDLATLGGWRVVRNKAGKYEPVKGFDYDYFRKWVKWQLNLTVPMFMRQQQIELLAKQAADTIMSGVQVSEPELRAMYAQNHHSLVVQTLVFEVSDFRGKALLSPAAAEEFAKSHAKEVHQRYLAKFKDRKDLPRERWVRHILLKVSKDASDADWRAREREAARLLRKLTPDNFAEVAAAQSQDDATKASGGVVGWVGEKGGQLDEAVRKAVFEAPIGKPVGPVRGKDGWHLLLVEGERKGSWPEEAARRFVAYDLLREEQARKAAQQAAQAALKDARRAGGDLKKLFGEAEGQTGREHPEVKEVTVRRIDSTVPGLEEVAGLARKLWAMGGPGVYEEVVEVKRAGRPAAYAVLSVREVRKPDWKQFEQMKDLYEAQYLRIKQIDTLNAWVRKRCEQLASQGKIHLDKRYTLIRYTPREGGEEAKPITLKYHYCKQLPAHASDVIGQF